MCDSDDSDFEPLPPTLDISDEEDVYDVHSFVGAANLHVQENTLHDREPTHNGDSAFSNCLHPGRYLKQHTSTQTDSKYHRFGRGIEHADQLPRHTTKQPSHLT